MNFLDFYKKLGTRKLADFAKPKVLKADTVTLPKLSLYMYYGDKTDVTIKSHSNILSLQKKTVMYIVDTYHDPIGDLKKKTIKPEHFAKQLKAIDDGHKYVQVKRKLLLTPPSTLVINNYTFLSELYKYKSVPISTYDMHYNAIATMCEDANGNLAGPRNKFIEIKVPSKLPTLKDFEKSLSYSNKKVITTFTDETLLTLFQLYKWLSPKHKVGSPFNRLHDDALGNVVFVFRFGNHITFVNAKILKSLVKDYKLDTSIAGMTDKSARKLFMLFVIRNVISTPIDIASLGKDKSIYDNATMEVTEDNIDALLENIDSLEADIDNAPDTTEVADAITIDVVAPTVDEMLTKEDTVYSTATRALTNKLDAGILTEKEYDKQIAILMEQESKNVLKDAVVDPKILVIDEKENMLPDSPAILDKSMLVDTLTTYDATYIDEVMAKDTINTIYSLQNTGMVIANHETKDHVNFLGSNVEHSIKIQPPGGRAVTLKVVLPKVTEDGTFRSGGHTYTLIKQKTDVPIKKIDPTTVTLTSYYGKIFVAKAPFKKNDTGYKISTILKKMNSTEDSDIKLLVLGKQNVVATKLPLLYSQIGRYIKSFSKGQYKFVFSYKLRDTLLSKGTKLEDVEGKNYVLVAKKGSVPVVMDFDGTLYSYDGKYTELGNTLDIIGIDEQDLPIEFSTIRIMKYKLPTILFFIYYVGLSSIIKTLGAKVEKIERRKRRELTRHEYRVNFKDMSYILDKRDRQATMILAGLLDLKNIISNLDASHLDSRDGAISIMNEMELSSRYGTEIRLLDSLFVDPMTKQLLTIMKEPTTWMGLLMRSNELLLDDYAEHPRDVKGMVFKGYERINGMLYKELITALKDYENKNGIVQTKLSMNPYSVMTALQTDSTSMLVEDLNPISLLKQKEAVTALGAGGRSKETMSKETRGHHESEVGIISDAGKDSSDVGITNYFSSSPNLANVRGLVNSDIPDDELRNSSILSTTAMSMPASDRDDQ